MNSCKTVKDLLFSLSKDTELFLSNELDNYIQPTHKFSRRYIKRRKLILLNIGVNKIRSPFRRRILVPLFIILAMFTCAMGVPEIREPVITFIVHVYEEMTDFIIRMDSDSLNSIERKPTGFTLGYIPDGFRLIDTQKNTEIIMEIYQNNNGNVFSFAVHSYEQGINFSMDTENAKVTEITIQGFKSIMAEKDTGINIVVFDNTNQRIWNLSGDINQSIALKIVENAEIK
jgi:hypothetical protein